MLFCGKVYNAFPQKLVPNPIIISFPRYPTKILPKAVNSIPSLFYFSNPFAQQTKSIFTAEFAYAAFVSCAAKASGSHEYSYAPLKAIIAEFNQTTDRKEAQECEIAKLYEECLQEAHSKAILEIRNPPIQ
jgi:hypothetical protein